MNSIRVEPTWYCVHTQSINRRTVNSSPRRRGISLRRVMKTMKHDYQPVMSVEGCCSSQHSYCNRVKYLCCNMNIIVSQTGTTLPVSQPIVKVARVHIPISPNKLPFPLADSPPSAALVASFLVIRWMRMIEIMRPESCTYTLHSSMCHCLMHSNGVSVPVCLVPFCRICSWRSHLQ